MVNVPDGLPKIRHALSPVARIVRCIETPIAVELPTLIGDPSQHAALDAVNVMSTITTAQSIAAA